MADVRRRVLIVDDYLDAREMYSEFLRFSGFDVIEAADGKEALQRAFETLPDIIVMDLSLPGMDGWEAARRLKADARTSAIPVMVLTGRPLDDERLVDANYDAYVMKPCLPEDLVTRILAVLRNLP